MIFRTAGVIATLLIGLGVPSGEVRAQYYSPSPPRAYPPPPSPPYRPLSPADADDAEPPQVPYYRSPSGAWVPHAGAAQPGAAGSTEANAGGSGPAQSDPRTSDPRYMALPPEDRPETGPQKELPPQLRRTLVDYYTKQPAGTIIIDTPNTYLFLVLGNGKALRYGIGVGREGFTWTGTEKISRMAEWPDWNPPEQMIERQPYLPRFMAGGDGNPLGARALYLGETLYRIHGTNQPSTIGSFVSSGCIRLTNEDITDLYRRVRVGTRVVVLPGGSSANAASAPPGSPRGDLGLSPTRVPSASDMPTKRRKPEDIVAKLRQVEVLVSQGQSIADATHQTGLTERTYFRWRHERGGLKTDELKSPKEPAHEAPKDSDNARRTNLKAEAGFEE